ncbi:thioredoxin family protein [Paenisporosarcina cavernae]|uniref:Thioredoxin n=1 Tax=Paenisporosarcina cavernae TaxID=2320858 RepID=A0A385YU98_9BACL|nr:thioredoxin family protein [Paenisporosarcina cavernae]AYC29880.1 thioredoxin [Paenisporosarcina cavernae]
MMELETTEQLQGFKNGDFTVFHFTADWCPDCRFLDPILPTIENEHPEITFVTIDRDKFIDVCVGMDIFGIPSFVAFKNGNEVGRFVSKERKTKEEIEQFLHTL